MPGEGHMKVTIFHAVSVVAIRHMVQTASQKYGCKKMPRGLSIPSFVGQMDGSPEGSHRLKPAAEHPPGRCGMAEMLRPFYGPQFCKHFVIF